MAGTTDASDRITMRMPAEMRLKLERMADADGMAVSALSRKLLERALDDSDGEGASSNAMDRLVEAQARLLEAQARRCEIENERLECGMPLPGDEGSRNMSLVIVGNSDHLQALAQAQAPMFGDGVGRRPYKELADPHSR